MGEDCLTLRYEDFCADPEAALTGIAAFADLVPRPDAVAPEARFSTLQNSNARYLSMHEGRRYPPGAWRAFGYDLP